MEIKQDLVSIKLEMIKSNLEMELNLAMIKGFQILKNKMALDLVTIILKLISEIFNSL